MTRATALPASLVIDAATRRVRLSPVDPGFVQDPYPAYHAIRAACPVFFWEEYGHWCVARHADVASLFRDRRFGREITHVASREQLGWPAIPEHLQPFYAIESLSMLEREAPVHTRLRGLVNRAFVSRTVERLQPRLEMLAHRLIDGFEARGSIDLLPAFAEPIPAVMIAEMLGLPVDLVPRLLEWSHRMVAMYQFNRSRQTEDDATAATIEFSACLRSHIAARRDAPLDDVLSLLLSAAPSGDRLCEDEIIASAILLLNAGHEATVHAIGNAVASILVSKHDPAVLFASPQSTAATVEEVLRHDPPLHLFTRYALEAVEIDGATLARGERIGLLIGAANRDPAVFPEPDGLEPSRQARPHLAFGAGIHFCIGAPLARLELQVALPILFSRLPGLHLGQPPRYADRYHFHGLDALRLDF